MDFLIWRICQLLPKIAKFPKIKFSGGHNVIAVETLNKKTALISQILLYGTSTLLIFRLTEVIAMVAQLYLLPASFWQNDMS